MRRKARHLKKPHFPDHQNLAKGGVVKHYDSGGSIALSGPGDGTIGNAVNPANVGFTGSIGNTLGLNNTFQAAGAPVQAGTNAAQLNNAYTGTGEAIGEQGTISNSLNGQLGQAYWNQAQLGNELSAMAQGQGPNPAKAQLAQATGQNVANTTAEMAGQRGASSNVGLIARQAAQQGAATQQQAAGQAATLQAQQQIAAQQNLANLSGEQINQVGQAAANNTNAQLAEQGQLQSANSAYNNNLAGQQANINNVNSQTAQANANSNSAVFGGITNALSNIPVVGSLFKNEGGVIKMADGGSVNLGSISPGGASASSAAAPQIPGTAPLPLPVTPSWAKKKSGGSPMTPSGELSQDQIDAMPNNSAMTPDQAMSPTQSSALPDAGTPESFGIPTSLDAIAPEAASAAPAAALAFSRGGMLPIPDSMHFHNYFGGGKTFSSGGAVKAVVSPKEVYLSPDKVEKVLKEDADPMKIGHRFPGKDKVRGKDSLKNDVIPTTLQSGGVVIPVHITEHKDASERSRKFVRNAMAKHMKNPERRG